MFVVPTYQDDGFGGFNPFKAGAKFVNKAGNFAVNKAKKVATGSTKLAFVPFKATANISSAIVRTAFKQAGRTAGLVAKIPVDAVKDMGAGFVSPFKSQGGQVAVSPEGGGGGGGGGGGSYDPAAVEEASQALAVRGGPGAGGMSMPVKAAIAGGGLVAVFLIYKAMKKGGGRSSTAPKS